MIGDVKDLVMDLNGKVCGTSSVIEKFCNESTTSIGKNYAVMIVFAFFVQYGLPFMVSLFLIPIIGLNVIAFLTPFAMVTAPFMLAIDAGIFAILMIASFVITLFYWVFYFRMIGVLAVMPASFAIIAFITSFVPYIGQVTSSVISIIPWMPIAVMLHWLVYSGNARMLVVPVQ